MPKGVCISHSNLIANAEQSIFLRYAGKPYSVADRPKDEKYVGMLPLYHAFGQSWIFFMALKLGVPTYIMRAFRYEEFLGVVQRFQVTMLQVPPPVLTMLSKRGETARYDLSSLREIVSGAAPLSRELQNEVQRRFGVQVIQGWGMTEVTCCGMLVPGGVPDERGSVGVLAPGTEAKLVDEAGREIARKGVGRSEGGELLVRGPQVMLRYWRNEAATRDTLGPDGWLSTGDVCEVDEKGWFWVVDRKKELIKVNAFQVAPAELEQILLQNEHVSDAAVVGITLLVLPLGRRHHGRDGAIRPFGVVDADVSPEIQVSGRGPTARSSPARRAGSSLGTSRHGSSRGWPSTSTSSAVSCSSMRCHGSRVVKSSER